MRVLKITAIAIAATFAAQTLAAQALSRAEYIERYAPLAVAHAERYGIPASVKMAQGILESANGNSRLAVEGNTHFNIKVKASDNWRGRVVRHDDDRPDEPFRAYDTPEDSWIDHSEYLDTQPRYDSLFRYDATDYRSWARGLKNAGYATDPLYAEKLIKLIEDNELWRLDRPDNNNDRGNNTRNRNNRGDLAASRGTEIARSEPAAPASTEGLVDPDHFTVVVSPASKSTSKSASKKR
ncbi:MAG: glucosaminidase domain-containing protein [Alistipes sp.]|jgi:flagellum-specific peptidoglycan hydrolase FlgJ|nr:glucosaminidase domain-containing protein [Alistipes sp.]